MKTHKNFNFMEAMKTAELAERTRKEYQRRVNRWKDYLKERKMNCYRVTSRDLLKYQEYLLQTDHGKWTTNSFLIAIRSFYKFARQAGMINYDPTLGIHGLRTSHSAVPQMSPALRKLWLDWSAKLKPNVRAGFATMFGAGLKVGEAAHLRPCDVIYRNDRLYLDVRNSHFALDRRIPVMDYQAAQLLYNYWRPLRHSAGPLFKVESKTFQWHARRFAHQYHLGFNCHVLRRDFAIRMCKRGITIPSLKKLLGHSSDLQTFYYSLAKNNGDDDLHPDFHIND